MPEERRRSVAFVAGMDGRCDDDADEAARLAVLALDPDERAKVSEEVGHAKWREMNWQSRAGACGASPRRDDHVPPDLPEPDPCYEFGDPGSPKGPDRQPPAGRTGKGTHDRRCAEVDRRLLRWVLSHTTHELMKRVYWDKWFVFNSMEQRRMKGEPPEEEHRPPNSRRTSVKPGMDTDQLIHEHRKSLGQIQVEQGTSKVHMSSPPTSPNQGCLGVNPALFQGVTLSKRHAMSDDEYHKERDPAMFNEMAGFGAFDDGDGDDAGGAFGGDDAGGDTAPSPPPPASSDAARAAAERGLRPTPSPEKLRRPVYSPTPVDFSEGSLRDLFKTLDRDNSGFLAAEELRDFYASLDTMGAPPDDRFVDKVLREFGVLRDGKITFEEFAVVMLRVAAR